MRRHARVGCLTLCLAWASTGCTGSADSPGGGDAAERNDAGDAGAADLDGTVPEGIQPTTTPDNFGCAVHHSATGWGMGGAAHEPSSGLCGGLFLACALAALATSRRRSR